MIEGLTPVHSQVQQNVYSALLERNYGVKVGRMLLVQLHPEISTWREWVVPPLPKEVAASFAQREAEVMASK